MSLEEVVFSLHFWLGIASINKILYISKLHTLKQKFQKACNMNSFHVVDLVARADIISHTKKKLWTLFLSRGYFKFFLEKLKSESKWNTGLN